MNRVLLFICELVCVFATGINLEEFVPAHPLADNSTYGNTEQLHTTHLHLNLDVDFDTRVISGTVTHDLTCLENTQVLQLDAWDITVKNVRVENKGAAMRMRGYGANTNETESEYGISYL